MGKLFRVEIVKNRDGATPGEEFRNQYGIETNEAMSDDAPNGVLIKSQALRDAVIGLLQGETNLATPGIRILRAVISTPEIGDRGNPNSVRVISWGRSGARLGNPGAQMLPLEHVLKISFGGTAGRVGANQYRGVLWSDDVVLEGGSYHLKPGFDAFLGDSLMGAIDAAHVRPLLRTIRVRGGVVTSSEVERVAVVGIGFRQRTQKKKGVKITNPQEARAAVVEATTLMSRARSFIELFQDTNAVDEGLDLLYSLYNLGLQRINAKALPPRALPPVQ